MKTRRTINSLIALMIVAGMLLGGCSGSGVGGIFGKGSGTTVVTGKVTLSGSILGKPGMISSGMFPTGQTGTTTGVITGLNMKLNAGLYATAFSDATVDMYDADHPEWLFPVATGQTASDGSYTLSSMTNSAKNQGATYKDGDPIPAGSYTLVAYSGFGLGQKPTVAVQSIVQNFEGTIPNVDFEILPSDVAPAVIYMFGSSKVIDDQGNDTWGSQTTNYPANAAIQVTFSMPMWRDSLAAGVAISPAVAGRWSLSADWLTATYYLDPGVEMTLGQIYTVTVYGEDQLSSHEKVLNVYGNSIKKTAYGKFKASAADSISPTVQWNSPTVIEMGELVDVTQPFRIESNELLDVNGINLRGIGSKLGPDGNPVTIGVKPGVLFLGKNAAGLYVYEFMLGEPLALDTSYSLSVSGGKDLSGHTMNTLTGSIRTNDAANTLGIDPNASPDIQNMQAQVKSVFGRWVRAMNDRNLGQWQNVLSGEFYLEYDSSRGIDTTADINRDGRFSFGEFSDMLYSRGFPAWDYCGTILTGLIAPTGIPINVVPSSMTADFDFKLTATNIVNSQQCADAAPKETFYATVKYKNGGWRIVRASEGIDTRDKEINKPDLITTHLYEQTPVLGFWTNKNEIFDGVQFSKIPDDQELRGKFTWDSVSGVNTYVLIVADERDPKNGMAIALSNNVTSYITGSTNDPFANIASTGALDLSSKFGFSKDHTTFAFGDGGRYYWEVVGFGSATSIADPTNPNDPNFIGNKVIGDLLKDITATSMVKRFVMPGIYYDIIVQVRAGTSLSSTPITYDAGLGGYDLGNAYQATLSIQTKPSATSGFLAVWGSQLKVYPTVTFTSVSGAPATATQTVTLYNGSNDIYIYDIPYESYVAVYGNTQPIPRFKIVTAGGMPPVINVWEVKDDNGNTLSGDKWHYYQAPGAKKVSIMGAVSDMAINRLNINVRNEYGPQYSVSSMPTNSSTGDNIFDTTWLTTSPTPPDLDIYNGTNYIDIRSSGDTQYYASLIVYTDTGSTWVPPITIDSITALNDSGTTKKNSDYSNSADWEAALGSSSNYTVTITGKFKTPGTGSYNTWSKDGGGSSWGSLVSDEATGTFSFTALLYTGWNDVSIWDPSNNNGYWLHINTNETGKPIVKPTIMTINGASYNGSGTFATTQCSATITATAEPGKTYVYWSGNDGSSSYYESQYFQNLSSPPTTFSFVVPLVSTTAGATGNSSNVISIQDSNYRSAGVSITTTGNCPYTSPTSGLTEVRNASGTPIPLSGNYYDAGVSATITLVGNTNRPGSTVTASLNVCNQDENYSATADGSGNWTISDIRVYGTAGGSWLYISGPGYYGNIYVTSSNTQTFTPRLQITNAYVSGTTTSIALTTNACGYSYWDAGSASSIDIVGKSGFLNGTGNYTDTLNRNFPLTVSSSGTFSISGVPVYNGSDNRVYINFYNDPAGAAYHNMYITSTNPEVKPQFVTITSPYHGQTGVTGSQTVSGTITDPTGSGFSVGSCYAYIYSVQAGAWSYYSTRSNSGYLPMTCGSSSFSIPNVDFGDGTQYTLIEVYAYDSSTGQNHYDEIYVNATGYPHTYGKPGAASPAAETVEDRLHGESSAKFLSDIGR